MKLVVFVGIHTVDYVSSHSATPGNEPVLVAQFWQSLTIDTTDLISVLLIAREAEWGRASQFFKTCRCLPAR